MPRTKAVKKKVEPQICPWAAKMIDQIETAKKACLLKIDQSEKNFCDMVRTQLNKTKLSIPASIANKTIGELSVLPLNWSESRTNASVAQILNATKSLTEKKKKPLRRSQSFTEDEGYVTAENTSGGDRKSRPRSRLEKTARVSRSMSTRSTKTDKFKTPGARIPPTSYGTVTPKVKPNTPQVVLRRPKQGEVALSLQGSPLLTGNVVADDVANVNIPLNDGRVLSIQPQRGLRMSQIPILDEDVKKQLETLRDNLNKVVATSCRR